MFADLRLSRRDLLKASASTALASLSARVLAAAPEPTSVTPGLIEAARQEGKFAWYAALDLPIAEKIARAFEGNIRALPAAWSVRVPNAFSNASARNMGAASMRQT